MLWIIEIEVGAEWGDPYNAKTLYGVVEAETEEEAVAKSEKSANRWAAEDGDCYYASELHAHPAPTDTAGWRRYFREMEDEDLEEDEEDEEES